jgi:hypothetical protein
MASFKMLAASSVSVFSAMDDVALEIVMEVAASSEYLVVSIDSCIELIECLIDSRLSRREPASVA